MDAGRRHADRVLRKIEELIGESITSEYAEKRIKQYLDKYKERIDDVIEALDNGDITQREFSQWIDRTVLSGKEWEKVKNDIADDYQRQMDETIAKVAVAVGVVYLYTRNYTSYAIERTVAKMGNPISLKRVMLVPKPIIPKSKNPRQNKMWHRQHLQATIRHGMKKGESIDKIAKRVSRITGMDRRAATRTARTAVTSAEGKAALGAMYDAEAMGIGMTKRWYATKDNRTRTSHRIIDGEIVPLDEPFSNGLMYPGDSSGEPAEFYNCRCKLMGVADGMDLDSISTAPSGMGRLEWIATKPVSKPMPKEWDEWI